MRPNRRPLGNPAAHRNGPRVSVDHWGRVRMTRIQVVHGGPRRSGLLVRVGSLVAALAVIATTSTASGGWSGSRSIACPDSEADAGYARRVGIAVRARYDVWGNALLASKRGPTYDGARRFLS